MFHFFYKICILFGVLLSLPPFMAFIFFDTSFFLHILYAFAFAIPLMGKLTFILPFRLFQLLTIAAAGFGMLLPASPAASICLGLAGGGILHFSIRSTEALFSRHNPSAHGIFTAVLFLSAAVFSVFYSQQFHKSRILFLLMVVAGILLFPKRSCRPDTCMPAVPAFISRERFRKPCFFTAAITASVGIAFTMYPQPLPPLLFWTGLMSGSLFMGYYVSRKGIFSGCILLLFFCESPLVCLCFPDSLPVQSAGQILLAAAAGGFPVILPVLTYYLYGPVQYSISFARLFFCIPLGAICVLPFTSWTGQNTIPIEEPAICLLVLLVLSFFCIFFAWKQRFIILKNRRI